MIDFSYTDDQVRLRQEIIRFARQELSPGAAERDRGHEFSRDLWRKCGELGLPGLPVPPEYGGSGCDAVTTAVLLEALGYGCRDSGLVFSIGAHLLACVVPIWKHASEEQKRKYLPRLCDGSWICVNAMSEPDSGSDAFAMKTRAVPDGNGYRLSGTKTFASNGPVGDMALVFALTDPAKGYHGGVTAFLVEATTPGYRVGQTFEKMGLRTSPIGEVVFDDCYVGPEAVLGHVGAGAAQFTEAMDWERICLFASHVGTMERILESTIKYARNRRQFGQAIGKFQGVAHPIVDVKMNLEAARLLIYKAAWRLDHEKYVSLDASIAKLFTSEALVRSALTGVQVLGGYGFMVEYEMERALRDAVGSTLYSGTSEMQRNIIARWLGL